MVRYRVIANLRTIVLGLRRDFAQIATCCGINLVKRALHREADPRDRRRAINDMVRLRFAQLITCERRSPPLSTQLSDEQLRHEVRERFRPEL